MLRELLAPASLFIIIKFHMRTVIYICISSIVKLIDFLFQDFFRYYYSNYILLIAEAQ